MSALLIRCPVPAAAAEASAAAGLHAQTAQEQSSAPEGHQMRRYQAFARQAELPPVTVISETALQVGEATKIETSRLTQLTAQEKETLPGLLGVPAGVIAKVAQRLSEKRIAGAAEFAREVCVAVVDYRFLQQEWGRYQPPAEGQPVKAKAVAALEAGDLATAWALYDGLTRPGAPVTAPAPPVNLRILASQ